MNYTCKHIFIHTQKYIHTYFLSVYSYLRPCRMPNLFMDKKVTMYLFDNRADR